MTCSSEWSAWAGWAPTSCGGSCATGTPASRTTPAATRSTRWRSDGAVGARSLEEFVQKLDKPRVAWVMIPAGITDKVVQQLADLMEDGDIILNGGNSNYREDYDRAADLGQARHQLSRRRHERRRVGSRTRLLPDDRRRREGVRALRAAVRVDRAWARATSSAPRAGPATRRRRSRATCTAVPAGSGHFVKMVHNGIEYGIMAAYAEGLNVLAKANAGSKEQAHSAEETPLDQPQYFQYDLDLDEGRPRCGGAVRSSRRGCSTSPPARCTGNPDLEGIAGRVSDSGEGRWTVKAAIDEGVPVPVLSAALFARFSSRGEAAYADKLLSAMRKAFGGHVELPTGE